MNAPLERYLRDATRGLRPCDRRRVQRELRADLERLIDEQRLLGLDQPAATQAALSLYGDPAETALGFTRVHTLPRLQPLVPVFLALFAVVGVVTSTRASQALLVTAQGERPVCADLPAPALQCLSERQGWVALSDLIHLLQAQGWKVTSARTTAADVPGISNDVLRVTAAGVTFDLPNGPDHVHRARLAARGVMVPPDQTTFRRGDETFVQATALFGRLANLRELPVRIEQAAGRSTVRLAKTQIPFAFTELDPAEEVLWQTAGLALAQEFGLTVAAERQPKGLEHPVQVQVPAAGTYLLVYRHPQAAGVGYQVVQADAAGRLAARLPVEAVRVVAEPRLAWRSVGAVSVLRFTGRMNGSGARLIAESSAVLRP
ncbi:hypothetical protein [Deinococcus budaensis]|uniref:Uncharacterized protein n=1 Tax=Deinococcus budaensis TaxID=1665626 RepID=A0A7W8LQ07_9DEIO|nr:hypothetical protein [Deinococcus budaensis]MBB5234259.1 hypothetical protein [Deinococcus budaensis]